MIKMNEIEQDSKNLFTGVWKLIYKTFYAMAYTFVINIISRYLNFVFGLSIPENLITSILLILLSIYYVVVYFKKTNLYYLCGWIIGIVIMYTIGILTSENAFLYLVIPVGLYVLRYSISSISRRKNSFS